MLNEVMHTILGFSTDPRTDDVVAQRVLTLAKDRTPDLVVMVAFGDLSDTDHDPKARALAMAGGPREAGFATDAKAAEGAEGASMHAVCEQYAPTTIVIGTPRHRLLGDLWDEASVRHAKQHTDDVEALHED